MTTRVLAILMVSLVGIGLLSGCATTTREDLGGMVRGENPEYFSHPLRILALWTNGGGQVLQYGVLEPVYLLLHAPAPEFWGLTLEERRYWETRQEEWAKYLAGERPAYR